MACLLKRLDCLVALVLAMTLLPVNAMEDLANGWTASTKITIKSSQINGDLTEFPVYIDLNDMPTSFFSTVKSDGADIRVTNGNAMTQLPVELVDIDTNNGTGELWFQADFIDNGSNTNFFIHYGNGNATLPAAADTYGSQNVWSNGFIAVYHLSQDPNGDVASAIKNSVSNSIHGSPTGSMTSADLVDGKFGKAIEFDGTNDRISLGAGLSGLVNRTVSMWFKAGHLNDGNHVFYSSEGNNWQGYSMQGGGALKYHNVGGSALMTITGFKVQNWHQVSLRVENGVEMKVFKDGVDSSSTATITTVNNVSFGARNDVSFPFTGSMDEIQVSNVSRSPNWITANYNNQSNPENFYLVSNLTPLQASWTYKNKITIKSSQVNADLLDFPVYIDLSHMPSSFFTNVDANGADIRISKSDLITELPYELVEINTSNRTGELWFKADMLDNGSDTDFYIWYGRNGVAAYPANHHLGSRAVWSNYLGVWHLNQDVNGDPAGSVLDSSASQDHGNPGGTMLANDLINGPMGKALDFDGVDDDIDISGSSLSGARRWTVQAWAYARTATGNDAPILGDLTINSHPCCRLQSESLICYAANGSALFINGVNAGNFEPNAWHQFVFTYDATSAYVFLDAIQTFSGGTAGATLTSGSDDRIAGGQNASSEEFDGLIDEVRITNQTLSANWITTEYKNQNDPINFYSIDNASPLSSGWSSLKLTIQSSQVNGDLTNFPVYVDLSYFPDIFFTNVQSGGADIRVSTSDQVTLVPREVVSIDTANGTGELWFRANVIDNGSDTDFYIWYNNPSAVEPVAHSEFGSQSVWSNGFVSVYHLKEDPDIAVSSFSINDSVSYVRDASSNNMAGDDPVTGRLGKAMDFDGGNEFLRSENLSGISGNNTLSYSAWIKTDTLAAQKAVIGFGDSGSAGRTASLMINVQPGSSGFGLGPGGISFETAGGNGARTANGQILETGKWHYLSVVKAAGALNTSTTIYLDGSSVALSTSSTSTPNWTSDNIAIGDFADVGSLYPFDGVIDEARLSSKTRSANWISTEFNNQSSPNAFYKLNGANQLLTSWRDRSKITIQSSQVNGDLTNFPVYINLAHMPTSFFTKVKSDGRDIRVTKSDQTSELPFELVNLDTANGTGELWFKADMIDNGSDTEFYVLYGKDNVSAYSNDHIYGAESVWSGNYVGVWHLSEEGNSNDNGYRDSTSNANHANGVSMTAASDVAGVIGKAQDFDGSADYLSIAGSQNYAITTEAFTASMWFYQETPVSMYGVLLGLKTNAAAQFQITNSTDANYNFMCAFGGNAGVKTNVPTSNAWHKLSLTYDGASVTSTSSYKFYIDGVVQSLTTTPLSGGATNASAMAWRIGGTGDNYLNGRLDEVRVSGIERSANWITAEYNNQNSPNTFYKIIEIWRRFVWLATFLKLSGLLR